MLAEIVAALPVSAEVNPWPLRQFLFENDRAWPTLALLVRGDLDQATADLAPDLVERWDKKIIKSAQATLLDPVLGA